MKKIILFLLLLPLTFGHLDAGKDAVIDNYLVDFGYSPGEPKEGERIALSFSLRDFPEKEIVDFKKAWVRVSHEEEVLFVGVFAPEGKIVFFTHTFPEMGYYELTVRFFDEKEVLVEADFTLDVKADSVNKYYGLGRAIAIVEGIIIILLIIGFIWLKKH